MNITIILSIVAYFLLCVAIGKWCDAKGRSFGVGFFVSLFLSPVIGTIIVLFFKNGDEIKEKSYLHITDNDKLIITRVLSIVSISYGVVTVFHQTYSIIYFIPLFTFISPKYWWDKPIAWICYWITFIGATVNWINYVHKIFCAS